MPPIENAVCFLNFGRTVQTLFKYNLMETIHIYLLIKQYLKHEKIWQQNVLLKQTGMLISREVIERARQRDEQTEVWMEVRTQFHMPQYVLPLTMALLTSYTLSAHCASYNSWILNSWVLSLTVVVIDSLSTVSVSSNLNIYLYIRVWCSSCVRLSLMGEAIYLSIMVK